MDRVGILLVSKCLSGAAMIDAFQKSDEYVPEFYVVEKQVNPFISKRAAVHMVSPDLSLEDIADFAGKHKERIDFGLTDTEDFVVSGGRDVLEKESGVQMVCVSKRYAVEGSKADQRLLFDEIFGGANPAYKVFDPKDYKGSDDARREFRKTLSAIRSPVIKPDAPARGAGVGVWGSDFETEEAAEAFFMNLLSKGRVVVEERIEGEESSFHALSDGMHFVPTPLTRDYKRSLDGNEGSLTGGMGSYRGPDNHLPFLSDGEYRNLVDSEESAFRRWKGRGSNPGLRGVVLYDAVMHTGRGFKVLERNSRGGNTEFINLLTTLEDDLADICFRFLDGSLKGIRFRRAASVVTCAVPLSYGGGTPSSVGDEEIDLTAAEKVEDEAKGSIRVYPMDVRLVNGKALLGSSRSVAVVGVAPSTEEARALSLKGCSSLRGQLRWRRDVASSADIRRSKGHLVKLNRAVR